MGLKPNRSVSNTHESIIAVSVTCDTTFPGEMQHTQLPTADRNPIISQSMGTTEGQFGEPMSFIGVTFRIMGEGLFIGAEMTQRQLHHQTPPQHK